MAALIESIAPQGVRARVVDLDGSHAKEVVARAGAYGEAADDNALRVRLVSVSPDLLLAGRRDTRLR